MINMKEGINTSMVVTKVNHAAEREREGKNGEKLQHITSNVHNIRKDIFACLFSIHNTISLSCHEQLCLSGLRFERYFSHHRAR